MKVFFRVPGFMSVPVQVSCWFHVSFMSMKPLPADLGGFMPGFMPTPGRGVMPGLGRCFGQRVRKRAY